MQLFRVADLHEMRVYVPVPQSQSAAIPIGASASLTVSQYPDQTFAAKVATTANAVNEQSRTVLFELLAPNPRGQLLPGTYAQVHFKLAPEPGRLDIPASAVIFQEDGTELALLRPDGTVTLQRVVLGRNDGTSVEVVSGLAAQDAVIDSPPDSLVTGDRVNVAARRGGQDRVAVEYAAIAVKPFRLTLAAGLLVAGVRSGAGVPCARGGDTGCL
ncbi:MAG: efflux RND transporter periplasmic adaptor subunit [Rhodospirillales bacterium]